MRGTKWKSDTDRFWAKVDKSSGPDGCWIWVASTREGYGQFRVGGKRGRMAKTHRLSWEMANGPIPKTEETKHGTCVCHTCDTPLCVNPAHLFLGTQRDNISDRTAKLRTGRKLSPDDVRAIRRLRMSGASRRETADMFSVSIANVRMIEIGRTWRHVG